MLFQQQAVNLQAKHNCKSHTALSRKFPLFVKYYLTWLLIPVVSRYNTNLKLHNRKVVENAFEVILLLSFAVNTLCSLVWKHLLETFPFLSNNWQKMGNMRTRTEIVNTCILYGSSLFSDPVYLKLQQIQITSVVLFFKVGIIICTKLWYMFAYM